MTAIVCLAMFGQVPPTPREAPPVARVVVRGQGELLDEVPVLVPAPTSIEPGAYFLVGEGVPRPASVFRDRGETYLTAVLGTVKPAGEMALQLHKSEPKLVASRAGATPVPPKVELIDTAEAVEVRLDGRLFTTYRAKDGPKPYYFPLLAPDGRRLTRAFPMEDVPGEKRDHPHQRSLWFTHGKVNGVDFWSEEKGHGSIVETSRELTRAEPAFGQIRTTDDWIDPHGKVVCTDERVVRFYGTTRNRILDFEITIRATHGPVTFGDTKEGMFGVRVPTSMDVASKNGGKITNAEGLHDEAAWGKPSRWVDYTGPVPAGGSTVGIAILDHPSSFRHPTTWHVRPYGLFAANPFGWHDFGMKISGEYVIPAGALIRFAYRVIFHQGDTATAGLNAAYGGYAKPPAVDIKLE